MTQWIDHYLICFVHLVNANYVYIQNYYGLYGGGATSQYPVYGAGGMLTGGAGAAAFYPYLQYGEAANGGGAAAYSTGAQNVGYGGIQYPHHHHHNLYQYSAAGLGGYQHYAPSMSLAPSPALQSPGTINNNNLLFNLINYIWPEGQASQARTDIFDSVFCCATGVTMALPAAPLIPIPAHR